VIAGVDVPQRYRLADQGVRFVFAERTSRIVLAEHATAVPAAFSPDGKVGILAKRSDLRTMLIDPDPRRAKFRVQQHDARHGSIGVKVSFPCTAAILMKPRGSIVFSMRA
jgi:hypothetical protein